jgi:riboflavin kinase/FMN adenylyltransferase
VQIIRARRSLPESLGRKLRAPAVAIGNFDGVHRGHQALVNLAAQRAHSRGGEAAVFTFDPHPARVLAAPLAPPMLMGLDRRLELLAQAGADVAIVEPFTAELARLSAEDFVTVLRSEVGADDVVVGHDFSFGAGRRGDTRLLTDLGARAGMAVHVLPAVTIEGMVCSSTKIREFVLEGRMEGAELLLGRPFELEGRVVHGVARGRSIGVPTANLRPDADIVPELGIYAAWAEIPALGLRKRTAVSIGTNPTFAADCNLPPVVIEAHLIDFDGDLYAARLRLEFVTRLRAQRRFASVDDLVAEIRRDIQKVKELLP